jgi:signal transduction histidine kinase
VLRYGLPAAIWLAALGATFAAAPYIQRAIFVFFWIAVLAAAWYGGLGPALIAAVAAVLAVNYFLVPPLRDFWPVEPADLLTLAIFTAASTLVSTLAARSAAEQRRTADALADLATAHRQLQDQQVELEQQAVELEEQQVELEQQVEAAYAARADAELASRAKSDFLATMSHELRTPLNAIAGYVELLEMELRGPLTAAQREDLTRIRRNQRALLALVNDVLNLARIEAGSVPYDITAVPVDDALAEVEALIAPQVEAKALAYEYRRPAPAGDVEPVTVRADRDKLQQIVTNLVSNAVKFTPAGGRVTLDWEAGEREVRVRVTDTGRGIPADRLEAIFHPFVQVERGYTRTTDGTGLGLAISRDLARAMGGDIAVDSRVGEGSTFTLVLPRA